VPDPTADPPVPTAPDYPSQAARTRNFTLGVPRNISVVGDGARVVFLRSRTGDDPVNCLWVLDVDSATELLVFDPRSLGEARDEALTPAEQARRERARESAGGVVGYATDRAGRRATFALGGQLFLADLIGGEVRSLDAAGSVDDPRLDPDATRVAYVASGALRVLDLATGDDRVVAEDDDPDVFWGLPEFIAAEEMGRHRGYWWSPDGSRIAAARVDERPVGVWHLSDPTNPATASRPVRYPAAGTPNAVVTLHLLDLAGPAGVPVDVDWKIEAFPYLARAIWAEGAPLTLLVQSRDQGTTRVLEVDEATGRTTVVREDTDPAWVELVDGSPDRLPDGRLVHTVDSENTRRLAVDGQPVTPRGLQVRSILHAGPPTLVVASEEPTEVHVWSVEPGTEPRRLTSSEGLHTATAGGDVAVIVSRGLEAVGPRTVVLRAGREVAEIATVAEVPVVTPRPRFLTLGDRELRAALLLPNGADPNHPLPVLLDPYGGPHAQRVTRSAAAFVTPQWLADQGFAVLVVDGRGMAGRGPAWDREVFRDFSITLDDQVEALQAAGERFPFVDLSRVAIRGWSFGGFLAAMAILRRPDVFHAAIAGAPVTDQRLYDTHYTERYLGLPDQEPEAYRRSSVLEDAPTLERPLLLIHGLADDNVVVAHSLRLSAALFEAGRPHELVLLPNLTHLARSTVVAENLLRIQADFLRRTLQS
jgi:dipeptidyl-peptidase 4